MLGHARGVGAGEEEEEKGGRNPRKRRFLALERGTEIHLAYFVYLFYQ